MIDEIGELLAALVAIGFIIAIVVVIFPAIFEGFFTTDTGGWPTGAKVAFYAIPFVVLFAIIAAIVGEFS